MERAKEGSTWASLSAMLGTMATQAPGASAQAILTGGAMLAGALGVLLRDRGAARW